MSCPLLSALFAHSSWQPPPNSDNTKKVRFKDLEPDQGVNPALEVETTEVIQVDVVGEMPVEPQQSYASVLAGKGGEASIQTANHNTEEDDIDISDEDFIMGTQFGLPSIQFSDSAYKLMEASMARTMVLKLLGRNIGLHALTNKTYAIWKPSQPFTLMDLENGYFLARFQNDEDYEKVLAEGPWIIYGQYLTVQPWTMDFQTLQPYPTNVAKLDFYSATSNRRRFARIAVYVDLKKPLVSRVVVGNKIQVVEYENLPLVCFLVAGLATLGTVVPMFLSTIDINQTDIIAQTVNVSPGDEQYSPWKIVQKRRRRNQVGKAQKPELTKASKKTGSRYGILIETPNKNRKKALSQENNQDISKLDSITHNIARIQDKVGTMTKIPSYGVDPSGNNSHLIAEKQVFPSSHTHVMLPMQDESPRTPCETMKAGFTRNDEVVEVHGSDFLSSVKIKPSGPTRPTIQDAMQMVIQSVEGNLMFQVKETEPIVMDTSTNQ
ncbi:hypothetical protein F3Y22_tig00110785pilonHSYRG00147 [Hibiscus syriacus]|uniref:DUF4283 domain-containing protein n=1 Tax=Hibiscus syriacus TaxID=106335 RepID=A0A6A2ZTU4_HIBSY|nr:hypothetical protein F3Y22_tig00110785pilonHSYRG00147 [Hibiscus syriacus]